jgi:hypothetical protein
MTHTTKKQIKRAAELAGKILGALFIAASILFITWIVFSFAEVQIHNWTALSEQPYEYSAFNLFNLLLNK